MRYVMIICLLFPFMGFAQTQVEYELLMGKFVKFYNSKQGDSIACLWQEKYREGLRHMWDPKQLATYMDKVGEIRSFQFLGMEPENPDHVAVFKTVFSKAGVKTTSLTIEDGNYMGTLVLVSDNERTEKMLKNSK